VGFLGVNHVITDMHEDVLAGVPPVIYFHKWRLHRLLIRVAFRVFQQILTQAEELSFLILRGEPEVPEDIGIIVD